MLSNTKEYRMEQQQKQISKFQTKTYLIPLSSTCAKKQQVASASKNALCKPESKAKQKIHDEAFLKCFK